MKRTDKIMDSLINEFKKNYSEKEIIEIAPELRYCEDNIGKRKIHRALIKDKHSGKMKIVASINDKDIN